MTEEILVGAVGDGRSRSRVVGALARDGILSVVEAESIDALVDACADRWPHVVVHAGTGDPSAALRRLARSLPRSRLVAVVTSPDRAVVRNALRAGADGVVGAADVPATLPVTVGAVWAGQTVVPRAARADVEAAELSQREREVLDLVAAGLSNAQIAERLTVTEHTVKSHLGSLFAKLGVHSRREAIAAHRQGHAAGSSHFGSSHERARWAPFTETRYETTVHRRQ
jgi:DNA-binding NarL/FixJ family response regulator